MTLERPELFDGREFLRFFLFAFFMASLSLSFEYYRYIQLTDFDDAVVDVEVVHQYSKNREGKNYQVLKLRIDGGGTFYTTDSSSIRDLQGYRLQLLIQTDRIGFVDYLQNFFAHSRIVGIYPTRSTRVDLSEAIRQGHPSSVAGQVFGALFVAAPMDQELREQLSALGVSHLLAISGFHLGVLSFLAFWSLYPLYKILQHRYMPYRHGKRDLFILVAAVLFAYLFFLEFVPSLVRAFAMMMVGFVLYDRGLRVLSMQTLLIAVVLLVACWPRLFFALGFWLSVSGVFFILLFLHHFAQWKKVWQFVGIHIWVYAMMLPVSLALFETFSIYHPLSVVWTILFILFYPLELFLHLIGFGMWLDAWLLQILNLGMAQKISLGWYVVILQFLLALGALRYKKMLIPLLGVVLTVFIYAVNEVA